MEKETKTIEEKYLEEQQKKDVRLTRLERRQRALKNFLEQNFESGKFFSIEEICKGVKDENGDYWYVLNDYDPYNHDKCAKLSNDIRKINWTFTDGYKLIIKDSKGGCKYAESKAEFEAWWNEEHEKVEQKYKYLNQLKAKVERDGMVFLFNQLGRPLGEKEMKPVEVFKKG